MTDHEEVIREFTQGLDDVFEDDQSYTGQNIDHTFDAVLSYCKDFWLSAIKKNAEKFMENLKDAMDEFNLLPDNVTQFAFYLKIADMQKFFDRIRQMKEKYEKKI